LPLPPACASAFGLWRTPCGGVSAPVPSPSAASPVVLPPSVVQSFASPQPLDHTAALVGMVDTTKYVAPIDSLMSQHAGDEGLDFVNWAVSATARQSGKASTSSSALLSSSSEAATVAEPLASSLDENLLETLAVGRRLSRT
jgi:hypothetical protein